MVVTPSEMVPLGTIAPDFSLLDVVSGNAVTLKDVSAGKKATVVMFILVPQVRLRKRIDVRGADGRGGVMRGARQ